MRELCTAHVLRHIREGFKDTICQGVSSDCVKDVVITTPAYFGEAQRNATQTAAIVAGFNPLAIINEPTAAALSFAVEEAKRGKSFKTRYILVFDFGQVFSDFVVCHLQLQLRCVKDH